MKYRTILLLGLIAFGVTLAVIVGRRLSAESMAVIVGVVAGVAASIPTSLIVVWVAARPAPGSRPAPAPVESAAPAGQPRIVVVQPSPAAQPLPSPAYSYAQPQPVHHLSYTPAYGMPPYAPPPERTFTIIGDEVLEGGPPMEW